MFTDLVNADKVAGRFRRYKIIFTPQKVTSGLEIIWKYAKVLWCCLIVMLWRSLQFYACETVLEEQGVYGGRLSVLMFLSLALCLLIIQTLTMTFFLRCYNRWVEFLHSSSGWRHPEFRAAWILQR